MLGDSNYKVYKILNDKNDVIYIGKTNNLKRRLSQHFSENGKIPNNEIKKVFYTSFPKEEDALMYELYFINKYKPKNNYDNTGVKINSFNLDLENIKWVNYENCIDEICNCVLDKILNYENTNKIDKELKIIFESIKKMKLNFGRPEKVTSIQIQQLQDKGLKQREIAEELNISLSSVRKGWVIKRVSKNLSWVNNILHFKNKQELLNYYKKVENEKIKRNCNGYFLEDESIKLRG